VGEAEEDLGLVTLHPHGLLHGGELTAVGHLGDAEGSGPVGQVDHADPLGGGDVEAGATTLHPADADEAGLDHVGQRLLHQDGLELAAGDVEDVLLQDESLFLSSLR